MVGSYVIASNGLLAQVGHRIKEFREFKEFREIRECHLKFPKFSKFSFVPKFSFVSSVSCCKGGMTLRCVGLPLLLAAEARDRRLRADYGVANLYEQLRILGQQQINTRAKLDEAHDAILLYALARLHIVHDAACNEARNLAHEHLAAILKADDSSGTLILCRRLGVPCHEEATMVVLGVLHLATYGQPVHVDVSHGHEDRYLKHFALKVLVVGDNLRNYHTAIAGREDEFVVVDLHTAWLTEKGHDKEPKDEEQSAKYPEICRYHGLNEEECQ